MKPDIANNIEPPFILATGIRKSYYQGSVETTVLEEVNLSVARGESLALLGVSGTGKSTLLSILGGIETADAGTLHINGTRLDMCPKALANHRCRNVGFVFQFYNLIPSLTVFENVLAGLDAMGALPQDAHARVLASLTAVGLADYAGAFPARLSGGQQQRVAITRAIVKRAPLILADEPTGNLDSATGEQVLQVLLDQCREMGTALIIVTHNPEIARHASRPVRLIDGRIYPCVQA